ncbi:MAG: hypothetical protein WCA22_22040 [Candidatus Binatus sp.]
MILTRLPILIVAIVALAGCSGVQQEEQHVDQDVAHLQQQQDALSAAIKKIQVVSGANVKGHPQYTTLGRVEGYCFDRPNSRSGPAVHGDRLKAAAYRKYGNQVDAIVKTSVWFASDDNYAPSEPYTESGYFECAGTAVHFTGESAPPAPPAQPPTG